MTYYLGKVGRAGARLMSSCKDLYNDVNAAYLTGATDVIVVKQRDGTLKSTPFHVRFGKLGVLRTGDLKEVEIEVNGRPVDLTMNIDETGKVFFCLSRSSEVSQSTDSDREHVAIEIEGEEPKNTSPPSLRRAHPGAESMPNMRHMSSRGVESGRNTKRKFLSNDKENSDLMPHSSVPVGNLTASTSQILEPRLSLPMATAPISISSSSSSNAREGLYSNSMPDRLELGVLSDSAIETGRVRFSEDEEDCDFHLAALSDTEVELKDRRKANVFWKDSKEVTEVSVGEVTASSARTNISEEERHKPHKDQGSSSSSVDRPGFWGALTGMLKMRHYKRMVSEDGIYLDDIDSENMDPDELSKFFPNSAPQLEVPGPSGAELMTPLGGETNFTYSSGVGSSPTHSLSPSTSVADLHQPAKLKDLIDTLSGISLSLCGGLSLGIVTEEIFQNSLVPFPEFCADPLSILSNPDLVVSVDGRFYSWQVAAPIVMSAIVYLQVLPQKTMDKVTKHDEPKKSRQSFWSFWGRGQKEDMETERAKSVGASPSSSPRKWKEEVRERKDSEEVPNEKGGGVKYNGSKDADLGVKPLRRDSEEGVISSDEEMDEVRNTVRPRQRSLKRKKTGFTNNLTSEQLESLCLEPGPNKVQFSITTKYQGTAKALCTVYLWNYNDKIVVSDIDGTITRSDVAGQVLPFLGMDWTQNGVVELFNAISKNGYRIAYLSARAIGQAGYTKDFLRKLRRGPASLPDGPLFLFPFSLYKAFRKEVIERRPEEFKINCLKQIRAIFPNDFSPLHAGFGNRHTDVKSYTNVGIPESRIFTVNHKGVLKHELCFTFQSSYTYLVDLVDRQFPPLNRHQLLRPQKSHSICDNEDLKEEFSTFNYWRPPIVAIELPDIS